MHNKYPSKLLEGTNFYSMKIKFINLFLYISLIFLSSCVTKMIWGSEHYKEKISQFLVGSDGRYVVLIGENYHYVFSDNSGMLKKVLNLNQKGILTIDTKETYLELKSNNNVEGSFIIKGPFSVLPSHDKNILLNLGFKPDKNDDLTVKINLNGKRYLSRYIGNSSEKSSYIINIYYRKKSNLIKDAGKTAITPIAITLDAVLFIGKIILVYPSLSLGS